MNVLVTGANGFIGRALCRRLSADGYKVRGAVRGVTQMTALSSRVEGVQVGNIDSETDWSKALNGVDTVVHLAARVHVMNATASEPLAAFRWVNVKGTERLAQQAVDANVRRFFFMSSVKVNGERTDPQITQITRIRKKGAENRGHPGEICFAPVPFPEATPVKYASLLIGMNFTRQAGRAG